MNDEFDGYIVVSFSNATLVLSIGDTVEEVNDSGFLGTVPTLRVQLLQDDSLIQVSCGTWILGNELGALAALKQQRRCASRHRRSCVQLHTHLHIYTAQHGCIALAAVRPCLHAVPSLPVQQIAGHWPWTWLTSTDHPALALLLDSDARTTVDSSPAWLLLSMPACRCTQAACGISGQMGASTNGSLQGMRPCRRPPATAARWCWRCPEAACSSLSWPLAAQVSCRCGTPATLMLVNLVSLRGPGCRALCAVCLLKGSSGLALAAKVESQQTQLRAFLVLMCHWNPHLCHAM